ncbi:hypothetical protein KEM48_002852 [Puccinia striiformis f. sp. tritici PST-130]|nr:hypothetical protein KEM48_002852 [Puccinia striiformis f. sp. tritici PST-130]
MRRSSAGYPVSSSRHSPSLAQSLPDSSNNSTANASNLANLPGFDSTINSTPSSSSNATNHTTATTGNNTSTDTNPGGVEVYCPSVIASAIVNGTTTPSSSSAGKSANSSASDFGAMVSSVFGDKLVTQLGGSNPSTSLTYSRQYPANSTTTSAQQQIYIQTRHIHEYQLSFPFPSPYLIRQSTM